MGFLRRGGRLRKIRKLAISEINRRLLYLKNKSRQAVGEWRGGGRFLYAHDRTCGWSSDLDGLFIRTTRLRHRHRRLCTRTGKVLGSAKKHSSANSERIGASNAADGPPTLTFHGVFSWRECKVAGISARLPRSHSFYSRRETHTCLSSSDLHPLSPSSTIT